MKVKFELTEKDIKQGKRYQPKACPFHYALQRVIDPKVKFEVECESVFLGPEATAVDLTKKIKVEIEKFDRKGWIKPGKFVLDIPAGYLREEL